MPMQEILRELDTGVQLEVQKMLRKSRGSSASASGLRKGRHGAVESPALCAEAKRVVLKSMLRKGDHIHTFIYTCFYTYICIEVHAFIHSCIHSLTHL